MCLVYPRNNCYNKSTRAYYNYFRNWAAVLRSLPLSYVRMFVPYDIDKQSSEDAQDIVEGIYGRCQKGVLNVNIVLSFHREIAEMVINQQN